MKVLQSSFLMFLIVGFTTKTLLGRAGA